MATILNDLVQALVVISHDADFRRKVTGHRCRIHDGRIGSPETHVSRVAADAAEP